MVWTVFLIPVVALICVFTYVSVATWSENRRKEREAFYRNDTYQKMLDGSAESVEKVRALIHEAEERRELHRQQSLKMGLKLGGLITAVAGLGLAVFLLFVVPEDPVYMVGLIPLLIGVVLALYGFFMKSPDSAGAG